MVSAEFRVLRSDLMLPLLSVVEGKAKGVEKTARFRERDGKRNVAHKPYNRHNRLKEIEELEEVRVKVEKK